MRFAPQVLSALLLFAAATGVAQAQSITNGSFEGQLVTSPVGTLFPGTKFEGTGRILPTLNILGWEVTSGNVELIENLWKQPGTGVNTVDLKGTLPGTLRQLVSGFTKGVTYALSWDMAANPSNGLYSDPLKNVMVSFYDSTDLTSKKFSASAAGNTFQTMDRSRRTFEFTAPNSGAYYVQFQALADTTLEGVYTPGYVNEFTEGAVIDNVALSVVAVPGPAAGAGLPVAAFAAGGMMWLRRRRAVAKVVLA